LLYKSGFGEISPGREALHGFLRDPIAIDNHGKRVTPGGCCREYIALNKAALFHFMFLRYQI